MSDVPHESTSATDPALPSADPADGGSTVLSAAEREARLTVGQWSALFSPEGVEFNPVDDPVLVLVPDATRSPRFIPSPRAPAKGGLRGESAEHTFIGNSATLHFDGGDAPAATTPLHLANRLALTYGQIIALAGDFYGFPDAPISDDPKPPARFIAAFGTLANQSQSVAEANRILQIMQTEIDAVNAAVKKGLQPSTVYATLGDSLNDQYNVATGGGSATSPLLPFGRYLQLALINWDHFGTHAITAYTTGHQAAMAQAIAAGKATDPAAKRAQLVLAYAMNAFADHFLTDLFSSGHLRTPRKELYYEADDGPLYGPLVGSSLAKFMHGEDSCWGLAVQNDVGRQWTAYGDKKFLDKVNTVNASIVEQAVQISVDEIYHAYTSGIPQPLVPLRYVPQLQPLRDSKQGPNPAALFIYDGHSVQVRKDLANRYDYSWSSLRNAKFIAFELWRINRGTPCANNEIPIELNANIIQLWDNHGRLGMIVYSPTHENAYGPVWHCDDMGAGSGAVAWLSVIAAEQTNIVQLWDNQGTLGITVFVPDGAGGYRLGPSNPNTGAGSGALAWFVCDLGDSQPHIAQLWDNQGTLGIIVYKPDEAKGYVFDKSDTIVGQGSAALAWLSISNEGKTHIVQIRDAGEALGIVVYSPDGAGGYAFSHQIGFEPKITSTVAWLTVDLDGSGTRHLIQLFDKRGQLGMVIYYWPFTGSPFEIPDLGEGSGAVAWLTTEAGDDKTDIVQLWNNNGQLGMIVYSPVGTGTLAEYRVNGHTDGLGEGSGALAFFASELLV